MHLAFLECEDLAQYSREFNSHSRCAKVRRDDEMSHPSVRGSVRFDISFDQFLCDSCLSDTLCSSVEAHSFDHVFSAMRRVCSTVIVCG